MEKFEKYDNQEKKERKQKGLTRRQFLKALGISGTAAALCPENLPKAEWWPESRYEKHGWYYTLEEMEKIYESEYSSHKKLLKNVFRRENEKWVGTIRNKQIEIPQKFIDKTLKHLKDMLEQKTAKFLFRLDASHGHFFVPEDKYLKHYAHLNITEQTQLLLNDESLGILFHNSEHLKIDENNPEAMELFKRRNVIGWYDSRPLEILPLPDPQEGIGSAAIPPGRQLGPFLHFAAHKDGAFSIIVNNQEIRLDFSFDDLTYY